MLGNAVPSLLIEVLTREIRRQLLGSPARGHLKLLSPRRNKVPGPEKVTKVPSQFLSLIGQHPEHPGTGKGRAARERLAKLQPTLF